MKVLFSHDHIFYKNDNDLYSNGGLSYEVLQRYTKIFEEITVLSRQEEILNKEKINNLTKASGSGVSFVKIPNFKSIKSIKNYKLAKKKVYDEVKSSDLIIARLPSSISKLTIKAAIEFKKPYLVELVGCAWDANMNHGSFIGKIIAPYEYFQLKSLVIQAPYVIYITKEFLQKRYPSNGIQIVCPNAKIEEVNPVVLENRLKSIDFNSGRSLKLGLIGSLDVKYKGHETTIRALAYLKNPNICVEFLGKGDSAPWERLANELDVKNQVVFKGSLSSGDAVYKWIDSIDIMVQPSTAEAQGRAIIEGMSRGCPIISTKVGGIVELIDSKYLVRKKDYKNLANKILFFLQNKEAMKVAAMSNFNNTKEYYDYFIEKNRNYFLTKFKRENL